MARAKQNESVKGIQKTPNAQRGLASAKRDCCSHGPTGRRRRIGWWIGRSAGDDKKMRLRRHLTSSAERSIHLVRAVARRERRQ